MSKIRILSVSQENQFTRVCPYQYYLQRVKKTPGKETPALRFGSACHEVLETLHRAQRSGVCLPMDFLMYGFRKAYQPFRSRYAEFQARKLIGLYMDEILPEVNPLLIEEQFYLKIGPGEVAICTGVIDLYMASSIIVDFKFRDKVKKEPDSLQEICYWLGIQSVFGPGELIKEYWKITFVKTSGPDGCYRIVRERVEINFEKAISAFYDRMRTFAAALDYAYHFGIFHKNPKTRLCHPRWCAYYDTACDHLAAEDVPGLPYELPLGVAFTAEAKGD